MRFFKFVNGSSFANFSYLSYIVHSFFSIMFPVHFLYLSLTSKHSSRAIWRGLIYALKTHISPPIDGRPVSSFPTSKVARLILLMTAGMTFPGLFWFISVSLAPYVFILPWSSLSVYPHAISPVSQMSPPCGTQTRSLHT